MKIHHAFSRSSLLLLLLCQLSALTTTALPTEAEKRNIEIPMEDEQWTKTGKLRRLQADTFFPDDDPYWNPFGIMERKPCTPFEGIREDQLTSPLAGQACSANDCGGGCCRNYNWVLCDTDSSFPYLPCGKCLRVTDKMKRAHFNLYCNLQYRVSNLSNWSFPT